MYKSDRAPDRIAAAAAWAAQFNPDEYPDDPDDGRRDQNQFLAYESLRSQDNPAEMVRLLRRALKEFPTRVVVGGDWFHPRLSEAEANGAQCVLLAWHVLTVESRHAEEGA